MNVRNLQRMANYIRTIPQDRFSMSTYREDESNTAECNTVGCVVGHCTILDKELFNENKGDFGIWIRHYAGFSFSSPEWDWCFDPAWSCTDNTPSGAAKRIEWLIENGLPNDWMKQMCREKPLCYMQEPKEEPKQPKKKMVVETAGFELCYN